jgi:hypothetical protein
MGSLPTENDFDPWGGKPEAQNAWKHFGGLTLDEAHSKFCSSPHYYQEDFLFMGGKAFAFYFPVIEKYLLEFSPEKFILSEAWILARAIMFHFDEKELPDVLHLAARVQHLADFVKANIDLFQDPECDLNVAEAWQELDNRIRTVIERRAKIGG